MERVRRVFGGGRDLGGCVFGGGRDELGERGLVHRSQYRVVFGVGDLQQFLVLLVHLGLVGQLGKVRVEDLAVHVVHGSVDGRQLVGRVRVLGQQGSVQRIHGSRVLCAGHVFVELVVHGVQALVGLDGVVVCVFEQLLLGVRPGGVVLGLKHGLQRVCSHASLELSQVRLPVHVGGGSQVYVAFCIARKTGIAHRFVPGVVQGGNDVVGALALRVLHLLLVPLLEGIQGLAVFVVQDFVPRLGVQVLCAFDEHVVGSILAKVAQHA